MVTGIVDLGRLSVVVEEIELLFANNGLNLLDKDLVLRVCLERLNKQKSKQATDDLLANVSIGGLFKRIMKEKDKDEGEE